MKTKILTGAALMVAGIAAWAAKDPVIMTVNGVDVPLSEFEYLYHKNSEQQLSSQPIDEYLNLFELYKLKVADAKAEGIDTTASFLREMKQYRSDLAQPYLVDSTYLNSLVDETYLRSQKEVEFKHIMLRKSQNPEQDKAARLRADSLRMAILQGQDFTTLARQYSQDNDASNNGGSLGFITTSLLPYEMETAAFTLAPGEVSEIVESPIGYHVIVGGESRPARGQALTSHIMVMVPQIASEQEQIEGKQRIDSLYTVLLNNPESFEEVAMNNSDDRNTARNGGLLPKFGAGQMVPEFDSVAFSLENNEISAPVRTRFGWHIIKKINSYEPLSREQMKPTLLARFNNPQDGRYKLIRNNQNARLAKKHKASLNNSTVARLKEMVNNHGLDSIFFATCAMPQIAKMPVAKVGKDNFTIKDFTKYVGTFRQPDPVLASKIFDNAIDNFYSNLLLEAEENWLDKNVADYHNLLTEYHDGSLLFEVSNQKVWDKASKDSEGLKAFFEKNINNYAWKEPHLKGILIQTANDSIADLVKQRLVTLGGDTIVRTLTKEFPKQLRAEVVLVKQGDNAMVDNLCFGGPEVKPSDASMSNYFIFNERMIMRPEVVSDVKGQATSDYQNYLEEQWINELRRKYPVVVNRQTLKKVK